MTRDCSFFTSARMSRRARSRTLGVTTNATDDPHRGNALTDYLSGDRSNAAASTWRAVVSIRPFGAWSLLRATQTGAIAMVSLIYGVRGHTPGSLKRYIAA